MLVWGRRLLLVTLLAVAAGFAQTPGNPLVLVLIGPPASGKTTQANYILQKYKIPTVTVEDVIPSDMERGDAAVNELIRAEVAKRDTASGFALDGYPATRAQADYLTGMLRDMHLPRPIIVQINVPDEVVWERAAGYDHDDVERRLAEYHQEMDVIRNYYPEVDIWKVDGTRSVEGVSTTIRLLIEDR